MSKSAPDEFAREVYEQNLWNGDELPVGPGWRAVGAYGIIQHNGLRTSLEVSYEALGVVVWVRDGA